MGAVKCTCGYNSYVCRYYVKATKECLIKLESERAKNGKK